MNRTLQPILRKLNAIFAKASGIFCASVRSFDALERHGRGQSQTAKMARDMLDLFEMAQAAHVVDPGAPRSCITADNIRSDGEPPLPPPWSAEVTASNLR